MTTEAILRALDTDKTPPEIASFKAGTSSAFTRYVGEVASLCLAQFQAPMHVVEEASVTELQKSILSSQLHQDIEKKGFGSEVIFCQGDGFFME